MRYPSLHFSWNELIQKTNATELAAKLTLLTLLFQHVGDWMVRPFILSIVGFALLAPDAYRNGRIWFTLAMLTGWRVWSDWPLSDNHAYLLSYWCLALALAFSQKENKNMLAINARLLIGLVFLFASIQKGLSSNYLDGTFFVTTFLLDGRFEDLTVLLTSLNYQQLYEMRDWLESASPDQSTLATTPFIIPESLRMLAQFSTWWNLIEQILVAVLFLSPVNSRLYHYRDAFLLLFCVTAYAIAPVSSFGWLLIAMAIAQCNNQKTRMKYLIVYALLAFYYSVPWANELVNFLSLQES